MDKISRMRELNELLAKASQAYYNTGAEIMSDHEYDALYDELEALEKETGVILNGSRTQQVGYEVASSLKKVKHPSKMLSLEKTKSVDELAAWLVDKKGFLSWKLDGLTLVLTYSGGKLVQAVTRGNGETGEEITQNARHIIGIPASIPFTGELVVRGESLMKYSDFERVNAETDEGSRYKNPRNLCVGTVRNLDSRVTAERNINLFRRTDTRKILLPSDWSGFHLSVFRQFTESLLTAAVFAPLFRSLPIRYGRMSSRLTVLF